MFCSIPATVLLLLTITSHVKVAHGGIGEPAIQIDEAPPDMRVPTDPGKNIATVFVPAYNFQNILFIECNDFIAENPVSFGIGSTRVTCIAQGSSDITVSFNIIVFDCEAPKFTFCDLAQNSAVAADGQTSAIVMYTPPPATDNDGTAPAVVCDPPPGTNFPIGSSQVKCWATDQAGNTITVATHQVTVAAPPPVNPAPVFVCGPHASTNPLDGSCSPCPNGSIGGSGGNCVFCEKGFVRGNRDGSAASGCVFAHGICDVWEKGVNGQCKICPSGKIGKEDERGCKTCPNGTVRGNPAGDQLSGCVSAAGICEAQEIGLGGKCIGCGTGTKPDVTFSECQPTRRSQTSARDTR